VAVFAVVNMAAVLITIIISPDEVVTVAAEAVIKAAVRLLTLM
jgi:hypothetical protein